MTTPPAAAPTDPDAPGRPITIDESRRPGTARGIAVLVLWAGAAVLTVVAAFAGLYSVTLADKTQRLGYSVDVAGRYSGGAAAFVARSGVHYTFVLFVCAIGFGLLAVGSVGRLLDLPTGPRLDLAITGGSFGATGVLAGIVVALYLQTTSTLGYVRSQVRAGFAVTTSIDAGPYLALGALACAVLALAATLWRRVGTDV